LANLITTAGDALDYPKRGAYEIPLGNHLFPHRVFGSVCVGHFVEVGFGEFLRQGVKRILMGRALVGGDFSTSQSPPNGLTVTDEEPSPAVPSFLKESFYPQLGIKGRFYWLAAIWTVGQTVGWGIRGKG